MPFPPNIKRLFVLMLENRSYDNIFGYSNFSGTTPDGQPTTADGLVGKAAFTNSDGHQTYTMAGEAPFQLGSDVGHEFSDVLAQLCIPGPGDVSVQDCQNDTATMQKYPNPPYAGDANQLGFAYCMAAHQCSIKDGFRCFSPEQLPVLNFLASQFAVCDRWFSSMPGPTWPNRFFALAGTSWGLDHSPSGAQTIMAQGANVGIFGAGNDSLLTRLDAGKWTVVYSGLAPQSWAMTGVRPHIDRFVKYPDFRTMLQVNDLDDSSLIFIEPDYAPGINVDFASGNSMHPIGDVRKGEQLIQEVYSYLLNSKYWEESVLLITFDEHGGFFDHVIPNDAIVPPDKKLTPTPPTDLTQRGFTFDRYGFRVPAVVVSPYVAAGTIDHSFYDHVSIAKTLNLIVDQQNPPLLATQRFAQADDFGKILTLATPRAKNSIPPCPDPAFPPDQGEGNDDTPPENPAWQ